MPSKTSKRVRKHRETQSLKSKQQAQQQHWQDLLADELQGDEVDNDIEAGSNALILPASKAAASGSAAATNGAAGPQVPLSKSQLKKLKQVQLKKQRREQLSQVLTQLHSSSLPEDQLGLLRPLHQRGAKETKKQRLRRALKLQRAGLTDVEGAQELLQPRRVRGVKRGAADDSSDSGSDSDSGRSSEDEAREPDAAGAQQHGVAVQQHGAAGQDSSSSDDEADGLERPAKQAKATAGAVGQSQQQEQGCAAGTLQQQQQAQLSALRAEARALKLQARAEAAAEGTGVPDEAEAEEAAAAKAAAAARAAAAAAGPTRVVHLQRPPEMEEARRQLPIIGLEQEVMEGINHNDVVVLCGETGCGKTTQVPQFLLEAGYGCPDFPERSGTICVTQPRRVAAISTAERVAAELGVKLGTTVGYQVRHDRRVGASSAVRFLTDGVLMRQLQSDFLLRTYSIILLDEAHERSLNTDLLLGMLSRLVPLRRRLHEQWKAAGCPPAAAGGSSVTSGPVYPLKLVIMSATLRTADFTENTRLFKSPPPVLSVPARQFPVTVHFAKHTELHDYLAAAVRKVCRIHRELPAGGILLFLTGQREVQVAVRRIRQAFAKKGAKGGSRHQAAAAAAAAAAAGGAEAGVLDDSVAAAEDADDGAAAGADAAELAADAADAALEADLLDAAAGDAAALDDFDLLEQDEDEEEVHVMGGDNWTPEELAAAEARFEEVFGLKLNPSSSGSAEQGQPAAGAAAGQPQQERPVAPVHVLPLYAMLPQAQQAAVFKPVPAGHRLIVVATNVAETSITIPGIRYVVDAGRSKQKLLEAGSSGGDGAVARYAVDWISKAAAEQRAGRAGRTGPGHVYRLYSSAHFNDSFRQHTDPEIANTPLEGVVLLLKAMGIDKVSNFPFPSPPDPEALQSATRCLIRLSALLPEHRQTPAEAAAAAAVGSGPLTALGRAMAVFPVTPRHSRMLLQLAIWQQQQQQASQAPGAASGGAVGGVSAGAAAKALPYAVALAATLSVESPFMHIDALNAETEAAAAEAATAEPAAGDAAGEDLEERQQQLLQQQRQTAEAKAANRKKMQAAAAAHARFRSPHGDAISALNALSAYEAAAAAEGGVEEFCAANFLHARHLREMSQLRQQLGRTLLQLQQGLGSGQQQPHSPALAAGGTAAEGQQLMQQLLSGLQEGGGRELEQPLPPPSAAVLEVLRRALTAGWCDQVARRVRSADYVKKLSEEGRLQRHATRYMPACLVEEVFLHPRSCLASTAPEYVVYMNVVRTAKRPYMALVTSVEPQWLADSGSSLCTVSEPLTEPGPVYNPDLDCVLAWHDASYSQHDWALPRLLLTHQDSHTRAAVFAAALLGGKVLSSMSALSAVLVAPAASAVRPELAGLARVGELLQALESKQVFTRASLAAVWSKEPTYLKQQLSMWVHKQHRHVLDSVWPQLLQEAAAGSAAGGAQHRKSKKSSARKKLRAGNK